MASIANGLIEYIKTDNGIHAIASSAYGVCNDLASTQIKTVNIPGFELEEGVTIHVKFENGNTAAIPKLNINNHENENIDIESVSGVPIDTLELGAMLTLTYDGTAWVKDYGSGGDNVDLTGIMRIIGQVDSISEYQPSHMTWGTPTISGMASGEYSPQVGDVISDADSTHEYMCVNVDDSYGGFWFMVGTIVSEYDSDNETSSTDDGSLTWISKITQNEDGSITATRTTIDVIPVANGGTGASTFNGDEVIVSDSTGETLTSVPYSDNTTSTAQSLDNTSTNFVTERYIYYGLPNINDDHSYNSDTTIYVPLNSGVEGQLLVSTGSSEPQWSPTAFLQNIPSAENEVPSYTHLILGGDDENSNHFAGKIELYSAESGTHSILGQDTVENREHTFPDNDGYVVQSSTLNTGNEYVPVYLDNGELTESFPVQKYEFTIANGQSSTIITHFAFNAHTYITQIVVDQGMENLNGPINWTSADANTENNETFGHIELTTTIATSGAVSGYFIIAHGDLLAPLPSI